MIGESISPEARMEYIMFGHFFLMIAAAVCIVMAAVAALRKREGWLQYHRKFALTGVVFALAAAICVETFKIWTSGPHFFTPHAVAGTVVLFLLIITPVAGIALVSGRKSLRMPHRISGMITSAAVILTSCAGIYLVIQGFLHQQG
jgi:uncharacterized membrane protein YozB (DUF420 family)